MNRNVESHFSLLPSADIPRSRFDRAQDVKFTGNVGDLIPFYIDEVLPGDTFEITTSKVVRLQTLLTPIMDNMYLDTYFFFVPNRLVWTHWRELMGENTQSAWLPEVEYSVPQIYFDPSGTEPYGVKVGDILDYMGVPTGVYDPVSGHKSCSINALPLRAYWKIYNDWFRDENLTDPVNSPDNDTDYSYYSVTAGGLDRPAKAAKYHDYFTSALPSPQKGPAVGVSIKDINNESWFPVYSLNHQIADPTNTSSSGYSSAAVHVKRYYNNELVEPANLAYESHLSSEVTRTNAQFNTSESTSVAGTFFDNLYAKANFDGAGAGILINDLRTAVQIQKLYERDARGGTRYIELIKSHFNVDSPDARLQRSEYLGGNRVALSIHQITNQSQGEQDFLGDVGAMSLTTDKNFDVKKSFTEHGFIIGICCVRYDHSYPQGLERMWSRKSRFHYYWPVFANLGEQTILKNEIMWQPNSGDAVFGYQERWAEYRYKPNRVAGEMRPGISNSLASWHLADYYTQVPSLSDSWIREDKTNVDRVLAVTSSVSNQFFVDIYVQNFTTRPMPLYSIPGLVDHH